MFEEKKRRAICAAVAQILKKERARCGLTLAAVAAKARLSYQMVRFVENQKRNPTLDTLLRICAAMNVDMVDVLRQATKTAQK